VVRTLERLSKEPPTEQDISDFVNVTATAATPPRGLPAIPSKIRSRQRQIQHNGWVLQAVAVMLSLAVIAVLAGLTVKLITPAAAPPGQIACLRYASDGSIAKFGALSHGVCPRGEYAVTIVQDP
jgi:predicted anti-sigma-YlaC factor YlaD